MYFILDDKSARYTLKSEAYALSNTQNISDSFVIDSTVGKDTSFRFDYSGQADTISIQLTSPQGHKFTKTSPIVSHNKNFGVYRFSIPGNAEVGKKLLWNLKQTTFLYLVRVEIHITHLLGPSQMKILLKQII